MYRVISQSHIDDKPMYISFYKEFSNFSGQFPHKQEKQSITPNGELNLHKQKLIPLLPTIHECPKLSESEDDSSRKEREETAIRLTPSKAW